MIVNDLCPIGYKKVGANCNEMDVTAPGCGGTVQDGACNECSYLSSSFTTDPACKLDYLNLNAIYSSEIPNLSKNVLEFETTKINIDSPAGYTLGFWIFGEKEGASTSYFKVNFENLIGIELDGINGSLKLIISNKEYTVENVDLNNFFGVWTYFKVGFHYDNENSVSQNKAFIEITSSKITIKNDITLLINDDSFLSEKLPLLFFKKIDVLKLRIEFSVANTLIFRNVILFKDYVRSNFED